MKKIVLLSNQQLNCLLLYNPMSFMGVYIYEINSYCSAFVAYKKRIFLHIVLKLKSISELVNYITYIVFIPFVHKLLFKNKTGYSTYQNEKFMLLETIIITNSFHPKCNHLTLSQTLFSFITLPIRKIL